MASPSGLLSKPLFWLPLMLVLGTVLAAPLFGSSPSPLQSTALALLLNGTVVLSGYLFVVIFQPERF
ncbi:potassium-transporting ATPase subunit F [Synechococcus sp. CS-1325]|uniref:potassium-transporting ATPase subunit F n=1 Tax=Synechococcus sp. CS-1325 TaxID=2847979 RepID=UPI00223BD368|nr:potassium-transporting ATPase subunit F [Synechococcus sp. CS-1325]MCT0199008.1 potassium-transporting ATPase subunit F [Synechococcus sp. CS-1325]